MAWVTPRTFVTDEFMTAAMFNTNIRDNIGEAWREVELITGANNVGATNSLTYSTHAGGVVASFATRDYPGYPIEITLEAFRLVGHVNNWCVLGVTDGTPGTTSPFPILMQVIDGEVSGLGISEFTPTPGSHSFKVALWGGAGGTGGIAGINSGGSYPWFGWQARLMEKALA